jgi:hypothetical protein
MLGGDRETGDCTAAVARQRLADNRGLMFYARSAKQQLITNGRTVFSVCFVPRCYKQDNWSNEYVVGQSSAGKNLSTEAEDIVGIRRQATTGEDTAD